MFLGTTRELRHQNSEHRYHQILPTKESILNDIFANGSSNDQPENSGVTQPGQKSGRCPLEVGNATRTIEFTQNYLNL